MPIPTLRFERLQPSHLDELALALLHPAVYEHIEHPMPSLQEFKRGLERGMAGPPQGQGSERWLNYLVRAPTGAMLGRLEATVHHGLAEVAVLVGPAHWGRGVASAGLQWLHGELRRVAAALDVWAAVSPANVRSQRLFERNGYRRVDPPQAPIYSHEPGDLVFHRQEAD